MSQSRSSSRWATGAVVTLCVIAATGATCGGSSSTPGTTAKQSSSEGGKAPEAAPRAEFHLYAFAQVAGTIAPCGCTTEPLGGLQYAFGYIESHSEASNRLVLEPGSFLFPEKDGPYWPEDDAAWEQARDRAKLLYTRFSSLGSALVSGIGPTDVVSPDGVAPLSTFGMPRVAANVTLPAEAKGVSLPPHRIVELTDHGVTWKVGVTAVVDPALAGTDALGTVADPVAAAAAATGAMRDAGADFTVVLAQGERAFAETLVAEGTDLVVVAKPDGAERERVGSPAAKIGSTYVLEPGTQLQTVTQLVVSVDAKAGAVPTVTAWDVVPPKSVLTAEVARVEARIEKFKADPEADAGFIANLEAEKGRLLAQLEGTASGPAHGVFEQIKVTCKLPVDADAKVALANYDKRVAEQNKERFTGVKPPPPAKGEAGYVGIEACSDCHDEAVEFWNNTVHANAYETLVVDNKQFDLSCVGCHVTGFRKPGGSEVVENAGLIDVQCEVCHGPGSLHAEDGGDDMSLIKLEAPAELCAGECHTPEHSDTFEYDAYLRDILGPGHGDAKRKLLGDGPTGHDLRQAGLAKAGGKCKKM